ncbi:23S rRNA (pseudouridine(1915)-N(3))-methyltransferase RlmH [Candidatus Peregrinibacteria bacterium]|nr:MAG: 23S rRNA (pseudouridine(1915)-N(3))-methyltransferase RlmH [Candidatus Peregrinibacteria bacterium]
MRFALLTPGTIKHSFFAEAQKEYLSRIQKFCTFDIREISEEKLTKNTSEEVTKKREAERLLSTFPNRSTVIALDERGKEFSAQEFSHFLDKLLLDGKDAFFCMGGANGLDASILEKANTVISFGKMTLTQDLARIVFLETMFRGFSILKNLPFHR